MLFYITNTLIYNIYWQAQFDANYWKPHTTAIGYAQKEQKNIIGKHYNYRLCGLVDRVSGYRYRGPGFDPRRYQIFWVVVGLEQGPLSLVRSIEELLEWKK